MTSGTNGIFLAKWAIEQYKNHLRDNKVYVSEMINTDNRQYLPGFGQMLFMIMLFDE